MKFICYKCGFNSTNLFEILNHLKPNSCAKKIIVIDTITLQSKL